MVIALTASPLRQQGVVPLPPAPWPALEHAGVVEEAVKERSDGAWWRRGVSPSHRPAGSR